MILSVEDRKELEAASEPLMKFLSKFHPHVCVVVDSTSAMFLEGVATHRTMKFIVDDHAMDPVRLTPRTAERP